MYKVHILFLHKDTTDLMFWLLKSLYVFKQAPKSFYDNIPKGLLEHVFKQSKKTTICVIYFDDTIFTDPDSKALEEVIINQGIFLVRDIVLIYYIIHVNYIFMLLMVKCMI